MCAEVRKGYVLKAVEGVCYVPETVDVVLCVLEVLEVMFCMLLCQFVVVLSSGS